ncbi:MAG: ECF transporter S component [Erysipelotrichaceae bacterium]|nr:ECF transporter S component [Erysipelotrichaceae bacterium]
MRNSKVRAMALAAIMGTIAYVLMLFKINVPILSVFADFDLSALAEIIGGFILGPIGAIEIISIKLLLKIATVGTQTMFTGELQNFLLSIAYVLPAVFYYRHHKTKKGAMIGLVIGSITCVVVAVITNLWIIFPFYIHLYGMDWDTIVSMSSAVNPWIKDVPTLIAFSIVPFNVISKTVVSVITMLVYKKISIPMKKFIQ